MKKSLLMAVFCISVISSSFAGNNGAHKAIAVLVPTQGNEVSGVVVFTQTNGKGVEVVADMTGLAPGEHGFHIHEFGDCSASNGASAGGHFNPHQKAHAGPKVVHRHVGDLGNIGADIEGKASYRKYNKLLSFKGRNNIIGHSVIIHVDQDDLKTQPTGDAGGRVACGVIGIAQS